MRGFLTALKQKGALEGNPYLSTQAIGIPLVALVFLALRLELQGWLARTDWILFSMFLAVYAIDFLWDGIRWDVLKQPLKSHHLVLGLLWLIVGSLLLFVLLLGAVFLGFEDIFPWYDLRWVLLGGFLYVLVKIVGGKTMSVFGPLCIAFVFAGALFWDLRSDDYLLRYQGFLLFLLNVLLMQWFEKDKDLMSNSPNLWLDFSEKVVAAVAFFLSVTIFLLWIEMDFQFGGIAAILVSYMVLLIFPKGFRPYRWYRFLIDGLLLLWLI